MGVLCSRMDGVQTLTSSFIYFAHLRERFPLENRQTIRANTASGYKKLSASGGYEHCKLLRENSDVKITQGKFRNKISEYAVTVSETVPYDQHSCVVSFSPGFKAFCRH